MARLDRSSVVARIEATGIIAVIRGDNAAQALDICRALQAGGVTACEIAMTTPGALKAIEKAVETVGQDCLVGVGTVLDAATATAAIHAGAAFIFAPTVDREVIDTAHRYDKPVVPGALTPTEILTAWSAGADLVKVFPANHFGPKYIKDIHGPLPQVKLTPTGGVDLKTAAEWIKAGAAALGVGSSLVNMELARGGKWQEIADLAHQYLQIVADTRRAMEGS